jgi:NTE family protein
MAVLSSSPGQRQSPPLASKRALHKTHRQQKRPDFACIALVLQGGGALGAYQGGVYQALAEAGLHPDWVAGISIGGINSALIAGNPPEARTEKLWEFWQSVTLEGLLGLGNRQGWPWARGDFARSILNKISAAHALLNGAANFFTPRPLPPWLQPPGSIEATSYFETAPLRTTLERLIDFDRINAGEMRLSLGAVNIGSGNFVYFDTTTHTIRPEHVMASGALPPGFPAVEIDGEFYWDGGLVSNTPLDWVVDSWPQQDTLAFQVDLWSARGDFPRTINQVLTRQKEIQYSSRTRATTDRFKYTQRLRNSISSLLEKLPPELKNTPEAGFLHNCAERNVYGVVHLICRAKSYEGDSKDYEFSRLSMEEHWRAGYNDTVRTLRHPEALRRPNTLEGVVTFDLARDGRE